MRHDRWSGRQERRGTCRLGASIRGTVTFQGDLLERLTRPPTRPRENRRPFFLTKPRTRPRQWQYPGRWEPPEDKGIPVFTDKFMGTFDETLTLPVWPGDVTSI